MSIWRRIWRFVLRAVTLGFLDSEESELDASQAIANLRSGLLRSKASVAKVLAHECRLERELVSEQQRLSKLNVGSPEAGACQARIDDLGVRLETARVDSGMALAKFRSFCRILLQAENGARDAQYSRQSSQIQTQVEQITLDSSLDQVFAALERLNADSRDKVSRAQAIRELNAALSQDLSGRVEEEPSEQRITGIDSGNE